MLSFLPVEKLFESHSFTFLNLRIILAFIFQPFLCFSLLELENCWLDFDWPLLIICSILFSKICWIRDHFWSLKCPLNHYYSSLLIIYRTHPYSIYYSAFYSYWSYSRSSTPSSKSCFIWSFASISLLLLKHSTYLNCFYFSSRLESFGIVFWCFDIPICRYLVVQIEHADCSRIFDFLLIVSVFALLPYCCRLFIIELCFWSRRRVVFGTFKLRGCPDFLLLSCLICVFLVFDLDFVGMILFSVFCLVCLIFCLSENGRIYSLFLMCIVDGAGFDDCQLHLCCVYCCFHCPMFLSIPLRFYANQPGLFEVAIIQKFLISLFLDLCHSKGWHHRVLLCRLFERNLVSLPASSSAYSANFLDYWFNCSCSSLRSSR